MKTKIYKFVLLALKKELEEQGYSSQEVKTLINKYSWFLSEYSLLRVLLRSKLPFDKCQQSLDFLVKRHEILAKEIKPKSTVLDIGCGLGILACLLGKKNCQVYGIDINEDSLKVARRLSKLLNVAKLCTFQKSESNILPFNTSIFDYVVLSWTLHDIKPDNRGSLLSECVRVLKSYGKCLVLDPENQLNFDQLHEMLSNQPVKRIQRKTLSTVYDHGVLSNVILVVYRKTTNREFKRKKMF